MLRLATLEDEDQILTLLKNFFNSTIYSSGFMDEDKVRVLIKACTDPLIKENVVLVWEDKGKVVGLIAGQWTELIFNEDKVATELVWWVEPEYRKTEAAHQLLGAFEYWADWCGCKSIQMYSLSNEYSNVLERFYKKQGYKLAETSYVKDL